MPALSPVKKENVGLGGSRMGTKERLCSWECYEKNCNKLLLRNIFFLEILIIVKAGRVN
jgi:hypothetical protein